MSARRTDFLELLEEAALATAPGVQADLRHRASQGIFDTKAGRVIAPPISATGIPERIRDVMWWKKSCLRAGEPYSAFKKRADAQRAVAEGLPDSAAGTR